ncbi:MAG TPA: epoxide hydrolase [Ktedonobacteraceae bacterium]|nr:epoxide hydrolase [Ktedonobacteraceae bacterium]
MITPYTLAIPQDDLDDLKARLARVRWTNEIPSVDIYYGVPLDPVKRLVKYWQEGYDWRTWEAKLNAYPQFTTTIDGQNIYFLHIRSNIDGALPLILTHGWPTSVVDYLNLIGPLTDPLSYGGTADQAFHLIIPALPGFGFSGPTHDTGWNQYRIARAWAELMRLLGYERYGVHGNDWGSVISPEVGRCDPEHVVGVHVTQIFTGPSGDPTEMEALSAEEKEQWQEFLWWEKNLGVYNPLQSTIPQTLGHALADSPVGQLVWNYQIYGDDVSDDYILTNVTIYWLTNTAASSARLYYEEAHARNVPTEPTTIPLALSRFANDYPSIRSFASRYHQNIVSWKVHDRGDHFATQTAPDLLINDIRTFFEQLRQR